MKLYKCRNLLRNIVLIPSLGVLGAAISTVATMIFWNLVLYLLVRKKVGINTFSVKRIFY
ncbi:hypothetical protein CHH77_18045 [Shouchella clausii]|uniref:polysaccharide biosynthesis C-terminal domain-containing protein n=1 Tax=Shouchella clausii TaxID=79880 RepID=UPI0009FE138F|nr:hypothetical protein CHI09_20020 [Shouchella clausii]PAE79984.1 hypothetical protein CHH77_18045 [Shouchella clausii]PAE91192.1 hypothetical protein CHH70_19870 [Shouchella clausii]